MRPRTTILLATLATTLVTGCANGTGTVVQATPTAGALPTVLVGHARAVEHGSLTAQDIANAQQQFGLDLMARVCIGGGANTLISPASAAEALGMLDAAAQGATASSLSTLLHLPLWSPAVLAAVHDHRIDLAALAAGKGDTLRSSNRVWPSVGNQPTSAFLDQLQTGYGGEVRTLDYAHHADQATQAINQQVSKDTDGLIPRVLDLPLAADTAGVLTNAMVLKARWADPFSVEATTTAFAAPTGAVAVRLMDSSTADYASAAGWQAAQIGYASGTLAAVAILPPLHSARCALPTSQQLSRLVKPSSATATVAMPRLHLTQSADLTPALLTMGLPLTGYSGLGKFVLTKVRQKDVMTVDDLGTVAAAATVIEGATATRGGPAHSLTFDRPYLVLLEDVATHTPLFLASVSDPTAS